MPRVRSRGELIRKYVLENVEAHPADIVRQTIEHFGITRQAAHRHFQNLVDEKSLVPAGKTRNRTYHLAPPTKWERSFAITPGLGESQVWLEVAPHLGSLPENVRTIWQYAFTEMFNNVIDHSGSDEAIVGIEKSAASTTIKITDFGVGIFKKIQKALNLADERHAVLELAKGKFTTDPANHSGQGIFFTSRALDDFRILSGTVFFSHHRGKDEDWVLGDEKDAPGTLVSMRLDNHTARTLTSVFDEFVDVDYGFTKTVVPVRLTLFGDDQLVSRSQAKRLLTRFEKFRTVMLDFTGVQTIGQAFADEVFRVFTRAHPEVRIVEINAEPQVEAMIHRARADAASGP
jgi:hypothetical protein